MRTTINIDGKGVTAYVKFHHHIINNSTKDKMFHGYVPPADFNGETICYLTFDDNPPIEATAFCSIGDQFCKAVGRKISLTRALEKANIDKTERRKIWDMYLENATV